MAAVLKVCTIEEQRCLCVFLWTKGLSAKDGHKEMFLFTVGSVYRVMRFTAGSRNVANFLLIMKGSKRRCGSGSDNSQKTFMPLVSTHW
jgi:hypothetical protein